MQCFSWGKTPPLSLGSNPKGIMPCQFPHAEICQVFLSAYSERQEKALLTMHLTERTKTVLSSEVDRNKDE